MDIIELRTRATEILKDKVFGDTTGDESKDAYESFKNLIFVIEHRSYNGRYLLKENEIGLVFIVGMYMPNMFVEAKHTGIRSIRIDLEHAMIDLLEGLNRMSREEVLLTFGLAG